LRIHGVGHDGIRADEAPYFRIVIPGTIIIEAGGIQALAGEFLVRGEGAGSGAGGTETEVLYGAGSAGGGVICHRGAAQVVLEEVAEGRACPLGYQFAAKVVGDNYKVFAPNLYLINSREFHPIRSCPLF
jgi:hypothetical protein